MSPAPGQQPGQQPPGIPGNTPQQGGPQSQQQPPTHQPPQQYYPQRYPTPPSGATQPIGPPNHRSTYPTHQVCKLILLIMNEILMLNSVCSGPRRQLALVQCQVNILMDLPSRNHHILMGHHQVPVNIVLLVRPRNHLLLSQHNRHIRYVAKIFF